MVWTASIQQTPFTAGSFPAVDLDTCPQPCNRSTTAPELIETHPQGELHGTFTRQD
jgi:hypothetical protein